MSSAAAELEELLRGADVAANGRAASEALAIVRRAPLHRPDLVLALGDVARCAHGSDSVPHWDIAEQHARAAAACGQSGVLERLAGLISARFPRSWRAEMLAGDAAEARGAWTAALRVYMRIVEEDPLRAAAYKRQIAMLKAQRRVPEAIALLNYFLRHFSTDVDGWAELTALCLAEGRMEHALFAANEVLIHSPSRFAAHVLVADVHMTMGGYQNWLSARRHYSASLSARRKGNMRALYGMWLAASALQRIGKWKELAYNEIDGSDVDRDTGGQGDGEGDGEGDGDGNSDFSGDDGADDNPTPEKRKRENERVLVWATTAIHFTYDSIEAGKDYGGVAIKENEISKRKKSGNCGSMTAVVRAALES